MLTLLLSAAAARVALLAERVDRAAVYWLLGRNDLPRQLVLPLLERLAGVAGAKLEVTELP
jgi:hypothetical protein